MTGYYLSVGYISGYSYKGSVDEAWQEMRTAAEKLCNDPDKLVAEALAFGCPKTCEQGCCDVQQFANRFKERTDLTIELDKEDEDGNPYIMMLAGGDREIKEHVRRAFCRLLICEMHLKGIEVNMKIC